MIDVTYSLFPNNGSGYDPAVTEVLAVVIAVLVTFAWGGTTLARYRFASTR